MFKILDWNTFISLWLYLNKREKKVEIQEETKLTLLQKYFVRKKNIND